MSSRLVSDGYSPFLLVGRWPRLLSALLARLHGRLLPSLVIVPAARSVRCRGLSRGAIVAPLLLHQSAVLSSLACPGAPFPACSAP